VATLGPPWSEAGEESLEAAILRAQGSIHDVLRLLDAEGFALDTNLRCMLDGLPGIDWTKVHALADRIAGRNSTKDFETMLTIVDGWLDSKVKQGAGSGLHNCARFLAPYALVWEKLTEAARETEIFNLDRRPLVLSLFAELAATERASWS
jgi:DNA polymerase-3 subunit delta'